MLMLPVNDALGASKAVMFPFWSRTKPRPLLLWLASQKYPVTSPRSLMLKPAVSDALGTSKTVIFPVRSRTKLRNLLLWLASSNVPMTSPPSLMLLHCVYKALGASKTVILPFRSRTKPLPLLWLWSPKEPVTSPLPLMLEASVPDALGASTTVKLCAGAVWVSPSKRVHRPSNVFSIRSLIGPPFLTITNAARRTAYSRSKKRIARTTRENRSAPQHRLSFVG